MSYIPRHLMPPRPPMEENPKWQIPLKVFLMREDALVPSKEHDGDAGWDLYLPEKADSIYLGVKEAFHGVSYYNNEILVDTGVAIIVPSGFVALIKEKSGLSLKKNLSVHAGVIDSTYRDSVKVLLRYRGMGGITLHPGQKIAQVLIVPVSTTTKVEVLEELPDSTRGTGGFGSTGV